MEHTTDYRNKLFRLGSSDESIDIVRGPDDWDLWLALRKTVPEVSFFINRAITIPPMIDPTTFFFGRITLMAAAGDEQGQTVRWRLGGDVYKGSMRSKFIFSALYNTESKTGHVIFRKR